jgi:hypothetical protein
MRTVTAELQINRQASAEEFQLASGWMGFYIWRHTPSLSPTSLHVSQVYIKRSTFQAKHCMLCSVHYKSQKLLSCILTQLSAKKESFEE